MTSLDAWAQTTRTRRRRKERLRAPVRRTYNCPMAMDRRNFLSGAVTATGMALGVGAARAAKTAPAAAADLGGSWAAVRDQFPLTRERVHLALMFFTSHPRPVRDAIDRHRRGFDEDPVTYFHENIERMEREQSEAAAAYLGAKPDE